MTLRAMWTQVAPVSNLFRRGLLKGAPKTVLYEKKMGRALGEWVEGAAMYKGAVHLRLYTVESKSVKPIPAE